MATDVYALQKELRRRIVAGDYVPGSRLSERSVASEHGVTRTAVQAAVRRLVSEGFVHRDGRGAAVVNGIAENNIANLYEMRETFWIAAVRLAATAAKDDDIQRLESLAALSRQAFADADAAGALAASTRFSEETLRMCGTPEVVDILEALGRRRYEPTPGIDVLRAVFTVNLELLDAYRAHDADAAETAIRTLSEHTTILARKQLLTDSVRVLDGASVSASLASSTEGPSPSTIQGEASETDRIIDQLREQVVLGELAPGKVIKGRELAAAMNIGRTPMRHALLALTCEGAVESRGPNTSVKVAMFDDESQARIHVVLDALDTFVARTATQRRAPHHLANIAASHRDSHAALERGDLRSAWVAALAFDRRLIEATENPIASSVYNAFRTRIERWLVTNVALSDLIDFQGDVVFAVSRRDRRLAHSLIPAETSEDLAYRRE